jgi:hypothetical protein
VLSGSGTFVNDALPNATVRNLGLGPNELRWTTTYQGCQSYDDVIINNNTVTSTAGLPKPVCENWAYLNADDPGSGTGYWTVEGGAGIFATKTAYNTIVTQLYDGNNTFRWTVFKNGCSNSTTTVITNYQFYVDAGSDRTIGTANTKLDAIDIGAPGSWSIISGAGVFDTPTDPLTIVDQLGFGINKFRWSVTKNNCVAYDDVVIIYNRWPANINPLYKEICEDTLTVVGSDPGLGASKWSVMSGSVEFSSDSTPVTKLLKIGRGQLPKMDTHHLKMLLLLINPLI